MNGTPIACTLSPRQLTTRMEDVGALARRALRKVEATNDGARFTFASDARAEIQVLIKAESECCAFLRFELTEHGGELQLTVGGPAEARPLIFELFGVAESEAVAN
jgi:hypothetical protein